MKGPYEIKKKIFCENWGENRHSPQRICSACKIYFFDWKKHGCPERTYIANGHVKPRRVKTRMQMRAGRKKHKNNECGHSVFFAFALDMN